MKRELVTGLLTLSLLASMLPANAAAAGSAPVSGQMVESQTGRESGAADSQLSSEAETGAFSFEDGTYETMEAAFAAASSGGTVTLTGRYGSGEGEKLVKIPANIVLQVASGAALTAELEDAAAILTSEGTLQVQAGGRLEFLGQTYVGTDADSVIRLQEGGITISGFDQGKSKFRIALEQNAVAEVPADQELKLTLPLQTGSGLDLTIGSGAELTVNGALAATGSQEDAGTGKPSQLTISGALTMGESGRLRMSYGSTLQVTASGTLKLNASGVMDNDPAGAKPYENTAKRFTYDQGAMLVVPAGCAWQAENFTDSPLTSFVDPFTGETIYGNNGSADVPEEGFAAAIGGTQYATLAEAVAAVRAGETIRLLRDVELDGTGLANNHGALLISRDVILDGNGYTISAKEGTFSVAGDNGGGPSLVNIQDDAEVVLRNVTFDGGSAAKHGINIYHAEKVTLENVEITGCRWYALVVNGTELSADGLSTSGNQWGVNIDQGSTVRLEDTEIAEGDSIVFEGVDASGSLTVESGSYQNIKTQGGTTAGSVTIAGGTVASVSNGAAADVSVTGGTVGTIENTGGGTAAISGGTVTGAVTNSGSGSITVTGGNFTTADVEEFVDPDQTVILTLDANGGSCAVKTLAAASGAAVGELPVPTRTGYTFAGWFTAASGGTQATGESVFDANATLYAHWTASDDSDGGSGSPSGEYLITVDRVTGGTVRVNPGRADKGDTVTITVTPKAGYELDELTVTDSKGSELNVRSAGSNKYTFEMPGSRVTVSASFARTGESGSDMPFTDVSAGAYYFDAVRWAAEEGITSGVTGTTFAPGRSCTRAQIITFLWRANGSPRAENTKNPFTDVSADAYYYDAVLWAVEEGITSGVTGTTFAPDASCTRAQAAVMLWRAEGSPAVSGTNPFRDVADDDYYADAVVWAVKNGVTQGTTAATFEPGEACTRAQIVTFLYRALG